MELIVILLEHYFELIGDQVQVNKQLATLYNAKYCERLERNRNGDARAFNFALATCDRNLLVKAIPNYVPRGSFRKLKTRLILSGDLTRFKLLASVVSGFETALLDVLMEKNDQLGYTALLDHCQEKDGFPRNESLAYCYDVFARKAIRANHPFLELVLEYAKANNIDLAWSICTSAAYSGNLPLIKRFSAGLSGSCARVFPRVLLNSAKERGELDKYVELLKSGQLGGYTEDLQQYI